MTTIEKTTTTIEMPREDFVIDDAQLAVVAYLARYSGRTLDAYRHDLRGFFAPVPEEGPRSAATVADPRELRRARRFGHVAADC